MFREKLNRIVQQSVTDENYCFHTGFGHRIPAEVTRFPAGWLLPLQLSDIEGQRDGFVTYQLSLLLMELPRKNRADENEKRWAAMERTALHILEQIAQTTEVFHIHSVRCTPQERTLTNLGEITLKTECSVKMRFIPTDFPSAHEIAI